MLGRAGEAGDAVSAKGVAVQFGGRVDGCGLGDEVGGVCCGDKARAMNMRTKMVRLTV